MNTINMQDIRHLNLFNQITRISTRYCMEYNNNLIFCVPRNLINQALGEDARNLKQISEILGKRIRVVAIPKGIEDVKQFIGDIIKPVEFKSIEVNKNEIIITAGSQNKASLIGRNKRRLFELQKIASDYFGKELKII